MSIPKALRGTGLSDEAFYVRHRARKPRPATKVTLTVELRCRQCGETKNAQFGPKWQPPNDGIISFCKNGCLAATVHDFVRIVPPKAT